MHRPERNRRRDEHQPEELLRGDPEPLHFNTGPRNVHVIAGSPPQGPACPPNQRKLNLLPRGLQRTITHDEFDLTLENFEQRKELADRFGVIGLVQQSVILGG